MISPLGSVTLKVNSPWGYRTHPVTGQKSSFHNGVDLSAAQGTPVVAPLDGTVLHVLDNATCGYGLVLQHDGYRTGYCHLSRIDVRKGQRVGAGEQIALSGGKQGTRGAGRSTGPHLHFIVYARRGSSPEDENTIQGTAKDWPSVDPMVLLEGSGVFFNPFAYAQEIWDWWWSEDTPDPLADAERGQTASQPPNKTPKPPKTSKAFWELDTSSGRSMRLRCPRGIHLPGEVDSGVYTVEVWNGQDWIAAGNVELAPSRSYLLTVRAGRIQLLER